MAVVAFCVSFGIARAQVGDFDFTPKRTEFVQIGDRPTSPHALLTWHKAIDAKAHKLLKDKISAVKLKRHSKAKSYTCTIKYEITSDRKIEGLTLGKSSGSRIFDKLACLAINQLEGDEVLAFPKELENGNFHTHTRLTVTF